MCFALSKYLKQKTPVGYFNRGLCLTSVALSTAHT